MGQKESKYSAIVAVDFGTTYSGYAYSYRRNKTKTFLNPNWGAEVTAEFWKTPTSVMYERSGNFDNFFGFRAEDKYFSEVEDLQDESKGKPSLYRCFKMQLYGDGKSNLFKEMGHKMLIKSDDEMEKRAMDVFADSLSYMKKEALSQIKGSLHKGKRDSQEDIIRWIVTVPAIWGDKQKLFMREACMQAGLIDQLNSRNLLIALEPECASLYCRKLSYDKFEGMKRDKVLKLENGTIYMVVDLGGGTVDITVHKIAGDKVEEVVEPRGGAYGGYNVNQEFVKLLETILGKDFIKFVKTSKPSVWLQVSIEFEKAKRGFSEDTDVRLPIQLGFAECFSDFHNKKKGLREVLSMQAEHGIKISDNGNMIIARETMKKLFDKVIDDIYDKVSDTLNIVRDEKRARVSYIYLVGGFADCKHVQDSIKLLEKTYETNLSVLVPHEASLCVLKGAVVYGHNPHAIKSRVARYTYAFLTKRPFNEKTDDISRKTGSQVDCLEPIIKKGDQITEGTVVEKTVKAGNITLYTSEHRIVDDPNLPTVHHLGTLMVDDKKLTKSVTMPSREIKVVFIFGNAELEVRAIDTSTQEEVVANFGFEGREKQNKCKVM